MCALYHALNFYTMDRLKVTAFVLSFMKYDGHTDS
jgi:hypothetical protein